MNQMTITPMFIQALETAKNACLISASTHEKEAKKDPDCSMNEYFLKVAEDCRLARVMIENFVHRATHDDYGDKIE